MEMLNNVNFANINGGELPRRFTQEFSRILEDIDNDEKPTEAKRSMILQIDFEHPDGPRAYLYRGVLRTIGHYPWYEWSNDWLWQKELIAPQTLEPHYAGPSRRTPSE